MELVPIFGFVVVLAVLVTALMVNAERARRVRNFYQALAAERGYHYTAGGWLGNRDRLDGSAGRLGVSVHPHIVSNGKSSTRFTRYVVRGLTPGLSLRRNGVGWQLWGVVAGDGIDTGDKTFDEFVRVDGSPLVASALLDADARAAVTTLLHGDGFGRSAWLKDGELVLQIRGYPESAEEVRTNLDLVLRVARSLDDPAPLQERLAAVAATDPVAAVRRAAVEALVRYGDTGERRAALRRALDDPDRGLRVFAAAGLREAEHLKDDLLSARGPGVALLVDMLEAVALAEDLLRGDAEVEDWVAAKLRHEDAAVVKAAAEALGEVGTVRSVPALHELRGGLLSLGAVPSAAARAIEHIQRRLGPVEGGSLALAGEGEAGALAVAEGEVGALGVAEGEEPEEAGVSVGALGGAPQVRPPARSGRAEVRRVVPEGGR